MSIRTVSDGVRHDSYARRMDGPMLLLAFLFLTFWSLTSIDVELPYDIGEVLLVVNAVIWIVLAVDMVVRIVLARSSWRYLIRHPLDVLAVVVPMLRPLKVLTVFTSGRQLLTSQGVVKTGQAVLASAAVIVWVGAVMVLNFERGAPDASINSIGDALWWAVVTVTTVGYGDFAPVTVGARIVAACLMAVGIAIIGVVAASVAAWFVRISAEKDEEEEEASLSKNAAEIRRLSRQIDAIERKIDALGERSSGEAR